MSAEFPRILLINPNSSAATTEMMVALAQAAARLRMVAARKPSDSATGAKSTSANTDLASGRLRSRRN